MSNTSGRRSNTVKHVTFNHHGTMQHAVSGSDVCDHGTIPASGMSSRQENVDHLL